MRQDTVLGPAPGDSDPYEPLPTWKLQREADRQERERKAREHDANTTKPPLLTADQLAQVVEAVKRDPAIARLLRAARPAYPKGMEGSRR